VIAAWCVLSLLAAQPGLGAERDVAAIVRRWVRQLDASELSRRDEAERALIALGPPALDVLPPPDDRTPPEIRRRLARVRSALEDAAARGAIRAATVTLDGEMPIAQALRAVEQQTGNRLAGFEDRDAVVQTDLRATPFWQALDRLLDASALTTDPYGGEPRTLVLVARPEGDTNRGERAAYDGAFRIEPLRIIAAKDLLRPAGNGLRVALGVGWEPRLDLILLEHDPATLRCADNQGRTVPVAGAMGKVEFSPRSGTTGLEFEVLFERPSRESRALASLDGELSALVAGRVESFVFGGDLAKARDVSVRKGAVTVVLEESSSRLGAYRIHARVRFDDASRALESHRGWIFSNEAWLVDAKGTRIEPASLDVTRQTPHEVGLDYWFNLPDGLEGHAFTYRGPTALVRHPVRFSFADLELP